MSGLLDMGVMRISGRLVGLPCVSSDLADPQAVCMRRGGRKRLPLVAVSRLSSPGARR